MTRIMKENIIPDIHHDENLGLATVLAAAVINRKFCNLLLNDPEAALKQGFNGELFALSEEETALFLSICADNLTDLAKGILATQTSLTWKAGAESA